MKVTDTKIPGILLVEPDVHGDSRGWFQETYNSDRYGDLGINTTFVQDNESFSCRGVMRGLHWQAPPFTQAKLVRVVTGAVLDVVVDIRKNSPTYGQHIAVELTGKNKKQLFVPRGFAHGFLVLRDGTVFDYKCDAPYNPGSERGMRFDDPTLGISLPNVGVPPVRSERDLCWPFFKDIVPLEGFENQE